jgi:hypothetical protein
MRTPLTLALLIVVIAPAAFTQLTVAQSTSSWTADIADIRRAAALIPGVRPTALNFLKFAESRRTKNFSVEGAPATPSVQARTAFQVMYPDAHVMVDAGMDQTVHDLSSPTSMETTWRASFADPRPRSSRQRRS